MTDKQKKFRIRYGSLVDSCHKIVTPDTNSIWCLEIFYDNFTKYSYAPMLNLKHFSK